jgi:hypothetical protein
VVTPSPTSADSGHGSGKRVSTTRLCFCVNFWDPLIRPSPKRKVNLV